MASQKKMSKNSQAIWENSSKGGKSIYSGSAVSVASPRTQDEGNSHDTFSQGEPFKLRPNHHGSKISRQSQVSRTSQVSINNFLNRNFHTINEQRQSVIKEATNRCNFERRFERVKATDQYRTVGGTSSIRSNGSSYSPKMKKSEPRVYINDSPVGKQNSRVMSRLSSHGKVQPQFKDKDYRPSLTANTRELSKLSRKKGPIYVTLHDEHQDHTIRRQTMVTQDIKKYKQMSKPSALKDNQISVQNLEKRFLRDFDAAYNKQLEAGYDLYFIDLFEDLRFLDSDKVAKQFDRIDELLRGSQRSLIINLKRTVKCDVKGNLEKICLAILNLQSSESKVGCPLSVATLRTQLNRLKAM